MTKTVSFLALKSEAFVESGKKQLSTAQAEFDRTNYRKSFAESRKSGQAHSPKRGQTEINIL